MAAKMLAAVFEFLTNQSDTVKVCSHCELFVLSLVFLAARASLCQCLMVQRQGQNNVAANLARVKLAVKAPQLHRMVAVEKAM